MPKFVIERQYLVPMYQHIVLEAENIEKACKKAVTDDIDWDTQEMDGDNARETTITDAKMVPEGHEASGRRLIITAETAQRPPAGIRSTSPRFSTRTKARQVSGWRSRGVDR